MYLSILNNEEKALFLGLAYKMATSDGEYSVEEQATISDYCLEMQIPFDESTTVKSIDNIISELNTKSDVRVKKIVVFEAIGLAMADNNYDEGERNIVNQMISAFDLDSEFSIECEQVIKEYISFQNRINKLVLEC